MNRTLIGIALLTLFTSVSRADDLQNYFVAPISTELQRATVSASADAYAIVNCNALLVDGQLDLSALDKDGFVSELSKMTASGGSLVLVLRYQSAANAGEQLRKRLKQRLKDLCSSAGYEKIRVINKSNSEDWKDTYQRVVAFKQPEEALEPLIENEHVRVFPVRTQLSKFFHSEADCIVELVRPVDGRMKKISPDLALSIRQAVKQAQISSKQTMLFKLSSTTAGNEIVETLFNPRSAPAIPKAEEAELLRTLGLVEEEYKPSPALRLAQLLGFEKIAYSHSADGGAPEILVGAKAPNFKLTRLNGDELDLHDFIDGRPALITFWGLACGPCRQEAPALTELHKKYGQDFAIVAVNGYNDDRESVAKYVTKASLTHPIVLQGKTISDDLYQAGAYPTTFWVNRDGTIVDYEVGFASSKRLENRAVDLLAR